MEKSTISDREFIFLNAMLISLAALATDMMLPALSIMAQDMGGVTGNDQQWVIAVFFISMNSGGIFFGPLSDSIGRRGTIAIGTAIFVLGCFMSALTNNFDTMLWGRLLQGLGASAINVATLTIVRDKYSGRNMARIMSFSMSIFIMVPTVAPLFGQLVMQHMDWHWIFYIFVIWSLLSLLWLWIRQPETLPIEKRYPFQFKIFMANLKTYFTTRVSLGYTIVNGFGFSILISYLMSAQQIFMGVYAVGDMFPAFFAMTALAFGGASFINGKLVMQLGMRKLFHLANKSIIIISGLAMVYLYAVDNSMPLELFMAVMIILFFCLGLSFGNTNSIAIEPLGHIAGIATAAIRFISGFIAVGMGTIIGQSYDGTIVPLITGCFVVASLAKLSAHWADR